MRKTINGILALSLKIGITVGALLYIFLRLRAEGSDTWQQALSLSGWEAAGLGAALLLSVPNWALEALKWQWMVRLFYPQESFRACFQSVLAGIATGIFTPNRIGEYAGRILYLTAGRRVEAVMLLFVDRICQMLVTLLTGTAALGVLLWLHAPRLAAAFSLPAGWLSLSLWILVAGNLITWALALSPRFVHRILTRLPLPHPLLRKAADALLQVDVGLMARMLGVGLLRNAVFTTQYLLLLYAFGYEGSVWLALAMVWVVFLIKSFIPHFAFSELGIRESTALTVMGLWGVPATTVVSATFVLYVFNLLLPALLGLLFVYRMRIET